MTDTQFSTTTARALLPPFTTEELPNLRANVAAAQANGDLAYAEAEQAGASLEECADAYHVAFVNAMWDFGQSVPCSCDYCRDAVAAERVSGWRMTPVQTRRVVTE